MTDRTLELQARFNAGNYDLTGFNGAGVTELLLKHTNVHLTASEPTTLFMLPLMYQGPKPIVASRSVPMIHASQRYGGIGRFEKIIVDSSITLNGSAPDLLPDGDLTTKKYNPLGLDRNIFDQQMDEASDVIDLVHWNANARDCAGTVVSLSNVTDAWVAGSYENIGNKCLGVSYSMSPNPMVVKYSPRRIHHVNSVMDFSAPPPNKPLKRDHVPFASVFDLYATEVWGRSKSAGWWVLDFDNVNIKSLPWPSPVQWSGFTVTTDIENARFKNCSFEGFLRAGLELRNTQGPVHIDGVTTRKSLMAIDFNGLRPTTYGAFNRSVDCRGTNVEDGRTIIEFTKETDWPAEIAAAKAKALEYGMVINFTL